MSDDEKAAAFEAGYKAACADHEDKTECYKDAYKDGAITAAKSAQTIIDEKDRQIADLVRQIKQLRDAIANANHILSRA